jgi:TetR/AcrR family transcriptional repressor of mexJK operon
MVRTTASRPPGRPKSEGKRTAIIEAARRLFVAHTFEAVTMDQVASAAGVAKMTVYGHFHDKESLFEATVQSTTDLMAAAMPRGPSRAGDLEDELVAFGEAFLSVLFGPGVVSSFYSHFEMLSRNRALAQRLVDAGPGRTRARLAAHLRSAAFWADLPPECSVDAASDLMHLWVGDRPQRMAMGLAEPITPDQIAQHVRRCTRLLLKGYGVQSTGQADGVQLQNEKNDSRKRGAARPARATPRRQAADTR